MFEYFSENWMESGFVTVTHTQRKANIKLMLPNILDYTTQTLKSTINLFASGI